VSTPSTSWQAARREFAEESRGNQLPGSPGAPLDPGPVKQPSGKVLTVFALRADLNLSRFHSETFTLEWPKP